MRFTPFDKAHDELSAEDLESLREVRCEGWYVEYKSQLPSTRDLAKSLSSFANQYGGWLFLGVDETPDSLTAGTFPGIENEKLPKVLESLRNAAKDIVRPHVAYQHRILEGPVETIRLSPIGLSLWFASQRVRIRHTSTTTVGFTSVLAIHHRRYQLRIKQRSIYSTGAERTGGHI